MTCKPLLLAGCLTILAATPGFGAEISGEYLEARSCDVWTGPCFANGEIGLSGKEAVLAWKVDKFWSMKKRISNNAMRWSLL